MLTAELVRFTRRRGQILPRFVPPRDPALLALASDMIATVEAHVGATRAELEEALACWIPAGQAGRVEQGLAKLLDKRCAWSTAAPVDPVALRETLFDLAANHHPVAPDPSAQGTPRAQLIEEAARRHGLTSLETEEALYADLKSAQRLTSFRTLSDTRLVERYNLALAQTLLLRAASMEVLVRETQAPVLRQLFRWLKFFQLMHRSHHSAEGLRVRIDGPSSILQQSQRYGVALGSFVALLPHLQRWELRAEIRWSPDRSPDLLRLDERSGLKPGWRLTGTWQSDAERMLREQLARTESPWQPCDESVLIPLQGGEVLVPDVTLVHRLDGRRVHLDIVGFWRRGWLESRWQSLQQAHIQGWILCLSRQLATERVDTTDCPTPLLTFASVIPLKQLLALVEQHALPPAVASSDT